MTFQIPDDKIPLAPMPTFQPKGWRTDIAPREGQTVQICSEDWRGFYMIQFPVVFSGARWLNAATGERLECEVAGWREWI